MNVDHSHTYNTRTDTVMQLHVHVQVLRCSADMIRGIIYLVLIGMSWKSIGAETLSVGRYCTDKFRHMDNHTMCLPYSQLELNQTEKVAIIEGHNAVRRRVTPPAADMLMMNYSYTLEMMAQKWAEQCQLRHDDPIQRYNPGHYHVGQNILITNNESVPWSEVIDVWETENSNFTYGETIDVQYVGNYTQMVWATTSAVGCGRAKCHGVHFYVCNYAPSVNEDNTSMPYVRSTSGQWCDDCPGHCDDPGGRLCGCHATLCLNGGVLDLRSCICQCDTERGYIPDYCELNCRVSTDANECGAGPFLPVTCTSSHRTIYNCPNMCRVCPYAGVDYIQEGVLLPWQRRTTTSKYTASTFPTSRQSGHGGSLRSLSYSTGVQSTRPAPFSRHPTRPNTVPASRPSTVSTAIPSTHFLPLGNGSVDQKLSVCFLTTVIYITVIYSALFVTRG